MTSFETEIYNRETDNVIGARVIVSADNGQTIDSIQVTNKTQFDELKGKLDTLNEDYAKFDDDSSIAGLTIDEILSNTNEVATINATTLNGFASDRFAKTGHTHLKKSITDLYSYDLSLSNYNVNMDDTVNVIVKVTNTSGTPVSGHTVIIQKDGTAWKTGNTNSNGVFTTTYTVDNPGIITFGVNNQKIQLLSSGWQQLTAPSKGQYGRSVTYYVNEASRMCLIGGSQSISSASVQDYIWAQIDTQYTPGYNAVISSHNPQYGSMYVNKDGEIVFKCLRAVTNPISLSFTGLWHY